MYELCPETPADTPEVEALMDLCFAPGRTALSSYRLREGVAPVAQLCLMLRNEYSVPVGAIRYWPVRIGDNRVLLLGPVAVHPTAQGEGFGGLLMRESLALATQMGWSRVMLVGDLPYYSRFGFGPLPGVDMPPPTNPDRILGMELVPGAWTGVTGLVERDTATVTPDTMADTGPGTGPDRAPDTGRGGTDGPLASAASQNGCRVVDAPAEGVAKADEHARRSGR